MRQALLVALILFFYTDFSRAEKSASGMINPYSKSAGEVFRKLPNVKKGGTLYTYILGNPKVFTYFLTNDFDTRNLLHFTQARLMEVDTDSYEFFPVLAEKLEMSKDHKVMQFTLRQGATWDDGSPITMDDVEFTYKTLMDPKYEAAELRANFGAFAFEKVNERTFKFTVEHPSLNTLININMDFIIMQKKQFANETDINKSKVNMNPMTSGPYRIKSFSRDQKIELERKKDWWGYKIPEMKNLYNFDNMVYRIIPDFGLVYEKFMRGEIDAVEMKSDFYGTHVKGTDHEKFDTAADQGKERWANHFKTLAPAQWTYVGWNMKHPMFASKKTRQALAMLVDYDQVINKVYFGEGIRCTSPFGSDSPNSTPEQKKKAFNLNPAKALALLKEDGWADTDQSGVLSKVINGKPTKFEFTIRYNSENAMRGKIAQIVKEGFKKAGISVTVQAIEWNTLLKMMDDRDFDALIMGWAGGNFDANVGQIWSSKAIENKGSNAVGYSNPEVDKLSDQVESELDRKKRFKTVQKIGSIIYDDQPYAFVVEIPGVIVGINKKIKAKKWMNRYDVTLPFWQYYSE